MDNEQLSKTSSLTISALYEGIKDALSIKKSLDTTQDSLLSSIIDLEILIEFVLIDLFVCQKSVLQTKGGYESRFHTKNLLAVISEGYKLIYGFGKQQKKSIWQKLKPFLKDINNEKVKTRYIRLGNLMKEYGEKYIDHDLRNLTFHYDENMMKVYKRTADINNIDKIIQNVIKFTEILNYMMKFVQDLYRFCDWTNIKKENLEIPSIPLLGQVHSILLNVFDKNGKFLAVLNTILNNDAGKSLDKLSVTGRTLEKARDFINSNIHQKDMPEFGNMIVLQNLVMLIQFMQLDLACVLHAWLYSDNGVEGAMILRRIMVIKVAVLTHLYGYNDIEREKSIWSYCKEMTHFEDYKLLAESKKIENRLRKLTLDDKDKEKRNIYVHYVTGNIQKNISSIAKSIEELDGFKLLKDLQEMAILSKDLQVYSKHLMNSLADNEQKQRENSYKELLVKSRKFEKIIRSSHLEEKYKNEFIQQSRQMVEFFKNPIKGYSFNSIVR